ncbi:MAG: aldehyde ferredoxin oxidoreductase family protein [Chloroflexi bacterium]|nr:aldehyde ferredoxin oxidoreductase family protein [Chloroflexota bacterium]
MANKHGYVGRILNIDLTDRTSWVEDLPDDLPKRFLGGRGFGAKLLYDRLAPDVDPLSTGNIMIFATGPLTGTLAPGSRLTITSRSPLTRGYADSNVGGQIGAEIKFAGYDVLILKGRSEQPVTVHIQDDRVRFLDASSLWGKGCTETESGVINSLGEDAKVLCIGPAGENMVKFACIGHHFGRQAGRTGMGAILGSKNVKAIAVQGTKGVTLANPGAFRQKALSMHDYLQSVPTTRQWRREGTAQFVELSKETSCLPVRNFQTGWLEDTSTINADCLANTIFVRNRACFGCSQICGLWCEVKDGPYAGAAVDGPEYEVIAMLGSNCGILDLKYVVRANQLCDDLGLDAISTGNIVAFAMECYERGIISDSEVGNQPLRFGQQEAALQVISSIAFRQGLGDVLAEGVRSASTTLGRGADKLALHCKGLEQAGYETRAGMGQALGHAIADRGSDHNRMWHPDFYMGPWRVPEGKGAAARQSQIERSAPDLLDVCRYASYPFKLQDYAELLTAGTGEQWEAPRIEEVAERVYNVARLINYRFGFTRADDRAPDRVFEEPVPDGPRQGCIVKRAEFEAMLDEFYRVSGWDTNGLPTPEHLRALDLEDMAGEALRLRERGR